MTGDIWRGFELCIRNGAINGAATGGPVQPKTIKSRSRPVVARENQCQVLESS